MELNTCKKAGYSISNLVPQKDKPLILNMQELRADSVFDELFEAVVWSHKAWADLDKDVYAVIWQQHTEHCDKNRFTSNRLMGVELYLYRAEASDAADAYNRHFKPKSMGFYYLEDDQEVPADHDDRASVSMISSPVFQMLVKHIQRKKKLNDQ